MDVGEMLDTCETASGIAAHNGGLELSQWEQEFLESVRTHFDSKGSLSEKQTDILTGLYDRT